MTPHGTNSTYTNYGCRCDECKAARQAYMRQYWDVNRDALLAANRAYSRAHLANPENRAAFNARNRLNYHKRKAQQVAS